MRDEPGWTFALTSEALAFFVAIEARGGRLSDNCVTLVPGSPKLHLRTASQQPGLALRDLHGATCN